MKLPYLNTVPVAQVPALIASREKVYRSLSDALNELGQHKPIAAHYLGAVTPMLSDRDAWLKRYKALEAMCNEVAAEIHALEGKL